MARFDLASISRRALVRTLGLVGTGILARPALAALTPTPAQSEGPFYPPPPDRFADTDWDLVRIEGHVRAAGGEILLLEGRVLDRDGRPVAGTAFEIWQCDANGRYLHHGDRRDAVPRDADFQGYGVTRTGADGSYRFRTIRPVPYPGRTPHIHARIYRPDGSALTTQFYIAGEPQNTRDFLFRRLDAAAREAVSMRVEPRGDGLATRLDVVV